MLPETQSNGGEAAQSATANEPAEAGGVAEGHVGLLGLHVHGGPRGGGESGVNAHQEPDAPESAGAETRERDGSHQRDQAAVRESVQDGGQDERQARVRITQTDIARALSLAKGDFRIAAAALGTSVAKLRAKVGKSPQLRAAFVTSVPVDPPTETSTISRTPGKLEIPESELAEELRKQEFDLMKGGLEKAGIKPETIQKLTVLDGLSPNSGRFLVSSLDLSHKMMIYSNIQLMERADYIKTKYLENETLEDEYKIEWQKCYNEIVDILGKGYDRTLAGTQAMAKIMQGQKDETTGGKKKPGFTPLRKVN